MPLKFILKCSMPILTFCFSIYWTPKIYIFLCCKSLSSLVTLAGGFREKNYEKQERAYSGMRVSPAWRLQGRNKVYGIRDQPQKMEWD